MFKSIHWKTLALAAASALALAGPAFAASDEDDEPINLSPVKKGSEKPEGGAPTVAPTEVPTAASTQAPTPTAMPSPTPRPTPRPQAPAVSIHGISVRQDENGLSLMLDASAPLKGRASMLKNPDRVLVAFSHARLAQSKMSKEIGMGAAVRARLAQHPGDEAWLVVDLTESVSYQGSSGPGGYTLTLGTGGAQAATPSSRRSADLPKINLMFFDLNVLFQGKQYDRFPCANFIYDKTDSFPLKREFVTTMVFHEGYGAFVGNLRIVDPKGKVIEHTKEPVAFNLFSELFDYSCEVPWKLEFPMKGFYSLILTLNGEDVLVHRFYVGHNDDKPEKN
jgi:hypothetical protein